MGSKNHKTDADADVTFFSPNIVRCSMHFGSWLLPAMALLARIFGAGCVLLHVHHHDSLDRNVCSKLIALCSSGICAVSAAAVCDRFSPFAALGSSVQSTQQKGITLDAFCLCRVKAACVNLRWPALWGLIPFLPTHI